MFNREENKFSVIKTKKFDDFTLTYKDDQKTRDAVFERLLAWFFKHKSFSGESIMQSDAPQIEAPVLLSDIADDIIEFDEDWHECV